MFFFCGLFICTVTYFVTRCTVNKSKMILFNTAAYIKHKIDEPVRLRMLEEQEDERSKDIIDTITCVDLMKGSEIIDITSEFKNIFEQDGKVDMSIHDLMSNELMSELLCFNNDDENFLCKLFIEYTLLGKEYVACFDNYVTFPMYHPPEKGDRLRPKRKVLSAFIGNNDEMSLNIDITDLMRKYAGPMHTFHSEFDTSFVPSMFISDTDFDHKLEYEESDNGWTLPVDQTIKIIDSRAVTYTTSLYDDNFEW